MPKKKSKKYWERRSEKQLLDLLSESDKVIKELESYYREAINDINKDIKSLYAQFSGENGINIDEATKLIHGSEFLEWRMSLGKYLEKIEATGDERLLLELNTLAMRSRITRLEALNAEIKANLAIVAQKTEKSTEEILSQSLENVYLENMYDEYRDYNPKVFELMSKHNVGLSKNQINKVLSMPWSGSNYSENIWNNTNLLAQKVQKLVAQNIIAGKSIDKLTKELTDVVGSNLRSSAGRLIRTEVAYVKGQADLLTYEKLEIEEYEILATLDTRTSKICQDQDGEHYPLDEAVVGENYPPFHPNCRSTTIKYIPNREGTRIARDSEGNNIHVPANMKYKEWENKYIHKIKYDDDSQFYESDYFKIHYDKISKYVLKEGSKHYKEFKNVGFSIDYSDDLLGQIYKEFAKNKKVYDNKNSHCYKSFYVIMNLGRTKKKAFSTIWCVDKKGDKPRFITAYRKDEKNK